MEKCNYCIKSTANGQCTVKDSCAEIKDKHCTNAIETMVKVKCSK